MIDFEVWPGPMEGIGKGGFVNAVNHLELVDRWMTPFFRLSQELPRRSKMASFISVFQPDKIPVCVQLMGVDPVLLGEAAVCFAELGATEINLNFGCPSSRVVSGGAGGGALKSPDKLADFCRIVRKQLPQQLPPGFMAGFVPQCAMGEIYGGHGIPPLQISVCRGVDS